MIGCFLDCVLFSYKLKIDNVYKIRLIVEESIAYLLGLGGAGGFNAQSLSALQQLGALNNAASNTGLSGLNSATGK